MSGKWRQIQTAFIASIGAFLSGIINAWPSYTLSYYTAKNTTLLTQPLTEMESSLLGSLPSLGAMLGTALVGYALDKLGKKNGGIVTSLPFLIGWVMIELASSSTLILIGRFLGGISSGCQLLYGPLYSSEVAEDSIRGSLSSLSLTLYSLGVLFSYIIGWVASYRVVIWLNIALSVLNIILLFIVVESPIFLLKNQRNQEALASLAIYRGLPTTSKVLLEEYSRLKQLITPAAEMKLVDNTVNESDVTEEQTEKDKLKTDNEIQGEEPQKRSTFKLLFTSAALRRAFIIVFTIVSIQVMTGIVAVLVYAKELFVQAAPNLSSHFCSVLFALVLAVGGCVTSALAEKAGRRILIITSSLSVGICMCVLGVLIQTAIAPAWVSAVLLLLYCFSFYCGAGTIPYVLMAELFVPEVQSLASTLILEWVWFLNFFIIGVFPYMIKYLGVAGTFYLFSFFGFADSICSYFIVPETSGLSTEEIQEKLLRKRR